MNIIEHFPLKDHTTWHLNQTARYAVEIHTPEDIGEFAKRKDLHTLPRYILGLGANTLFKDSEYNGVVLLSQIKKIEKLCEDEMYEYYRVGAGEDWDEVIKYFVFEKNLGGLENLAYIPGTFGSGPIQNVGAYGAEFASIIEAVHGMWIETAIPETILKSACKFSYRDSIFKHEPYRNNFCITYIDIRLTKISQHKTTTDYHSNYESLLGELEKFGPAPYSIQQIYNATVAIRRKKLPEVSQHGTNGSVFTNPIIKGSHLKKLLVDFPALQYYPPTGMSYIERDLQTIADGLDYKIAIGHILDKLGWRGKRIGNVGTWTNHALVVTTYGDSTPEQIYSFITAMAADIKEKTGLTLTPEINIV